MNADHIADWTVSDPVLQQVLRRVQQDWSEKCPDKSMEPFYVRSNELSTHNGCILWGEPCGDTSSGSETALRGPAHRPPRNGQMKNMARSYLWWPGLDTDIEDKVKRCKVCQLSRAAPAAAPLHP